MEISPSHASYAAIPATLVTVAIEISLSHTSYTAILATLATTGIEISRHCSHPSYPSYCTHKDLSLTLPSHYRDRDLSRKLVIAAILIEISPTYYPVLAHISYYRDGDLSRKLVTTAILVTIGIEISPASPIE